MFKRLKMFRMKKLYQIKIVSRDDNKTNFNCCPSYAMKKYSGDSYCLIDSDQV